MAFNIAGYLFEADQVSGNIYEFTPNGASITFASGLFLPTGLAFDSAGNLFVSDANNNGTIVKFLPNGASITFATGLGDHPHCLAFDGAGNLFLASGGIQEFTPDGTHSNFASGLDSPMCLAFAPVPEASTWFLGMLGVACLISSLRSRRGPQ